VVLIRRRKWLRTSRFRHPSFGEIREREQVCSTFLVGLLQAGRIRFDDIDRSLGTRRSLSRPRRRGSTRLRVFLFSNSGEVEAPRIDADAQRAGDAGGFLSDVLEGAPPTDMRLAGIGGGYEQGTTRERNLKIADVATAIAKERGTTTSQVAIGWILAKRRSFRSSVCELSRLVYGDTEMLIDDHLDPSGGR
jgi:hypothetical protein